MSRHKDTGVVDLQCPPGTNMYGCLPCPKCGSEKRVGYKTGRDAGKVCCDDCGFKEPARFRDDEE